jgi:hypothetical protein
MKMAKTVCVITARDVENGIEDGIKVDVPSTIFFCSLFL